MVYGTMHPNSQLALCDCGSGQLMVACHAPAQDGDCPCGSGDTFAACCCVTADELAARRDQLLERLPETRT